MKLWLNRVSRFFGGNARAVAAQRKLDLIGANKGLRRFQAKVARYEAFLEKNQIWIEYNRLAKEAEDRRRETKRTIWLRLHPEDKEKWEEKHGVAK